ncbi:AraC family transcriptional regulator [Solimonas marina]|uniref:AraC family transcriptional regulator n=1 Tax=Solimonas marina TaxID=2714601 RepID=A0A970B6S1_9GAMM|nr:AraC family transcriptional regulator [Solimonas marina]NKF24787.1 AraC family transcriptional regulator [Solimonas marina]
MTDPLSEVVGLLQPSARFSKSVLGAGAWHVQRAAGGEPFYCAVLEGGCRISLDGGTPITLEPGDFVLVPSAHSPAVSSLQAASPSQEYAHRALGNGEFRIGDQHGPTDMRMLVGHCSFGSPDAALLVSLLPRYVLIRGDPRLAVLAKLVGDETRAERPARDMVLMRLLEVLLIEALRSTAVAAASPGIVQGLADARLAMAIRAMHEKPEHPWTVIDLAREAALSRSTFFERFSRIVGAAPMEYLLTWRMARARQLLSAGDMSVSQVAESVGYRSASTFSVAFSRHVGMPPSSYRREPQKEELPTEPESSF